MRDVLTRCNRGRGPMRILTFTTLYPNSSRPTFGIFVENRIEQLVRSGTARVHVVAPVPTLPGLTRHYPLFRNNTKIPLHELRRGLTVDHPRYLHVPGTGTTVQPFSLFVTGLLHTRRLLARGLEFDIIDAHYLYPDGVAAVLLGRAIGKPVVMTGRGTDLTLLPDYPIPRHLIRWAAANADGLITVSGALKRRLASLCNGLEDRICVLRNGVDTDLFHPHNRMVAREHLGLRRTTLLSVGNLIPLKGHDLVIRSLGLLPEVDLLIVGDGPEERNLRALASDAGFSDRVRFLGRRPHSELRGIYEAADALVLASEREGWPNVVLEAMACGTPVAASNVWGIPEIVTPASGGELISERTPQHIAAAVLKLLEPGRREAARAHAERFSWDATTTGQLDLFRRILERRSATGASTNVI
jgi:teichuronic acid biosynthesis glycosyltransferase TuaC